MMMEKQAQESKPLQEALGEDASARDGELEQIVGEEQRVLDRVLRTIESRSKTPRRAPRIDYDRELLELRDQIRTARMEDVPPLIEEMERLQQVAARRAKVSEGVADPGSPYFGRLVLEETDEDDQVKKREVLIGRATYLDPKTGVRIVDWRDAPVSRVYYRCDEGDEYEETFGGREVFGEVLTRRALSIGQSQLRRISSPQGTFANSASGWRRLGMSSVQLRGGQGSAARKEHHSVPTGKLGVGNGSLSEDKSLGEITPLIDPRQFELITKPTSGLVVIQGGAGSGKTTIGLHRLAYLAYQDRRRFRADRMLVIVFNDALVRYIGHVLPALGVEDVPVTTYERWAEKLRKRHVMGLPAIYADDTPTIATRVKKHPVMLRLIDQICGEFAAKIDAEITEIGKTLEGGGRALRVWRETEDHAPATRLRALREWLKSGDGGGKLEASAKHALGRAVDAGLDRCRDVPEIWADILTDEARLQAAFAAFEGANKPSPTEVGWALSWCAKKVTAAIARRDARAIEREDQEDADMPRGIDGDAVDDEATIDREDDAILLRIVQRVVGPLRTKRDVLQYEHLFVDETQDISPLELAVVLETASKERSVTLAGDVAQKLHMDNGFTSWEAALGELGLDHVSVEPLNVSYRSTHEILEFATEVLGPLKNEVTGQATRNGAPVELFRFVNEGEAVAFLAEALRDLTRAEPLASVAIITRTPAQADTYFHGLKRSDVPHVRRVAEQDFLFRAGIDITDVTQVKGLEFDYVILVEVNMSTYPEEDEARHLLHIASTRAAHQLWVLSTGSPSMLLPQSLRDNAI